MRLIGPNAPYHGMFTPRLPLTTKESASKGEKLEIATLEAKEIAMNPFRALAAVGRKVLKRLTRA